MAGSDLLLAGVLFLFAAVIAVPLASRLGIGAVLGYLLAGIAIGPWGLGFISDVDEILHFSELGVVFLMFIIGLELNPAKLWRLRSSIFGVGAAQVMLSAAILGGLLMTTGFSWQAAVVGGIGLAMSSTAMALQLMREKGMSRSEAGQLGFSVLLFQDLAVIPALALVQGDRLVRYVPSPWPTGPVEFGRALNPKVFLLKLTPGLSPELIPAIFQHYDCVIVESFGVGGIPQRLMDAFAEGLGDYDQTHKILILTTQVTYEGSDVGIYEVGKRVKNRFRFLEAHDMTIEAVVTKIMWLLAQDCDSFDQLQQRFYRQVNFDTFYH